MGRALADAASRWETTVSAMLRDVLPGEALLDALIADAAATGDTPGSPLLSVLADGLRRRMRSYPKPVSTGLLAVLTPAGVIQVYGSWLQAVRADLGLPNLDGSQPRFKLAPIPTGGGWEKQGFTDYGVILRDWQYTPDGETRLPAPEAE
jgi:hypothetical protein